jgi:hypothetical protein
VRVQLEPGEDLPGAVGEQLNGIAGRQPAEREDRLAWQAQRLPAGHQHLQACAAAHQHQDEVAAGAHQMLTAIQHEQSLLPRQAVDKHLVQGLSGLREDACGRSHGRQHRCGGVQALQFRQVRAVGEPARDPGGQLQRQAGLAHADRPVQGDQPAALLQPPAQDGKLLATPDESVYRQRKRQTRRARTAILRHRSRLPLPVRALPAGAGAISRPPGRLRRYRQGAPAAYAAERQRRHLAG